MQGQLEKKTGGGKFKSRYFTLRDNELTWFKSDNKSTLCVKLSGKDVVIRDVKFGVRKFVFEVVADGRTLCLAASGETEKQQWIDALLKAAGQEPAPKDMKKQRESLKGLKKVDAAKVAGIANVLGLAADGGATPNIGMKSNEATERLKAKLAAAGATIPIFGAPMPSKRKETAQTNLTSEDDKSERSSSIGGDARTKEEIELEKGKKEELDRQKTAGPMQTFAQQAMEQRRKKLGITEEPKPASSKSESEDEVVADLPHQEPGQLDHSAQLSKPVIRRNTRQAPQIVNVAKLLPPAEIKDKVTHDFSFRVETGQGVALVAHATSQAERDKWVHCLANAIHAARLKRDLDLAQKSDMMAALKAQMHLEAYTNAYETTYAGYLEKLSVKSQRNWKKRYFELKDYKLSYYTDEKAKKAKYALELTHFSVVKDHEGKRIEAEVLNEPDDEEHQEEEHEEVKNTPTIKETDATSYAGNASLAPPRLQTFNSSSSATNNNNNNNNNNGVIPVMSIGLAAVPSPQSGKREHSRSAGRSSQLGRASDLSAKELSRRKESKSGADEEKFASSSASPVASSTLIEEQKRKDSKELLKQRSNSKFLSAGIESEREKQTSSRKLTGTSDDGTKTRSQRNLLAQQQQIEPVTITIDQNPEIKSDDDAQEYSPGRKKKENELNFFTNLENEIIHVQIQDELSKDLQPLSSSEPTSSSRKKSSSATKRLTDNDSLEKSPTKSVAAGSVNSRRTTSFGSLRLDRCVIL